MLRRIAPAVLATAVIAAGLTGCSAAPAGEVDRGDCVPAMGAGTLSDSVVVLGGFGAEPEVQIPEDTQVSVAQRSIVKPGPNGGTVADSGKLVTWNYAFYDQVSGEQLAASPGFGENDSASFLKVPEDDAMDAISAALRCTVPGDRVVAAFNPSDSQGLAMALQLGATPEASIVGVFDVVDVGAQRAEGSLRGLPSGFPAVVTNDTGVPGIVLPPRQAPVGLVSAVRVAGDGHAVEADDQVLVQMLTVSWTGSVTSNTWEGAGPQLIGSEEMAAQQGLNIREELTGAQVGSQLVITEGGDNSRVHVVDVLAAG